MRLRALISPRIADIPPEGNPGLSVLKRGTQADHLRGVAHLALAILDEFRRTNPEIVVDRDIRLTGALCHDVGKPYEFDPPNMARWTADPSAAGHPTLRHSVFGAHVCLAVGLPEEVAHIALGHSLEGQHIGVSTECLIVRHADHSWWQVAAGLGLLKPEFARQRRTHGPPPRRSSTELASLAAAEPGAAPMHRTLLMLGFARPLWTSTVLAQPADSVLAKVKSDGHAESLLRPDHARRLQGYEDRPVERRVRRPDQRACHLDEGEGRAGRGHFRHRCSSRSTAATATCSAPACSTTRPARWRSTTSSRSQPRG